ncbi:hypothetical protein RKD49_005884 [Streptomyces glaucescens]
MVEDQGGRQSQAGRGDQPVAQFDRRQGGEAEFGEHPAVADPFRGREAEHGRDRFPDDGPHLLLALLRAQTGQPLCEVAVGSGRGGGRLPVRGERLEQRARAGHRGGGDEGVPVDAGHGDADVVTGERPVQRGEPVVRVDALQADAGELPCDGRARRHAGARPGTPGDGGGGQPLGTPVLGQRVEAGVAGGVAALPGQTPGGGHGGEQDEGAQVRVVPGQEVEVAGAGHLGAQRPVQLGRGQGVEQGVVELSGGVHHRGERQVSGHIGDHGAQGVEVGGVARGERDPRAEGVEFGAQGVGSGCPFAPPADEQQVFRPGGREPPCHLGAERAGAAGDQGGAPGPPGASRAGRRGCAFEAPHEHAVRPYGELVLAGGGAAEDGGEVGGGRVVGVFGQVDQATPPLGVFQGDDPSQAPQLCLVGVAQAVAGAGGHGRRGDAPQGGGRVQVAERLDQGERGRQSGRHGGVPSGVAVVECQQGQDSGRGRLGEVGAEQSGDARAVGRRVDPDLSYVRAVRAQRACGRPRPRVGAGSGRAEHEPGAVQAGGRGGADAPPADPVAQGVQAGVGTASVVPPGQRGQQGGQRLGGRLVRRVAEADSQFLGERLRVALFDGRPEPALCLVGRLGRCVGGPAAGGFEPVALRPERVGGQLGVACSRPGEQHVPVHADAVGEVRRGGRHQAGGRAVGGGRRRHDALGSGGDGPQAREQVVAPGSQDHRAVLEHRPRGGQRVRRVQRARSGLGGQVAAQPQGEFAQRLRGLRGQREGHEVHAGRGRLAFRPGFGFGFGFFEDDVGVGPADPERRHPRPPRHPTRLLPRHRLRQQRHRTRRPVHLRRRLVHMQRPRQHTVPHRHHHLDHTGHTGRRLRMPDVRLQRPQKQRAFTRPLLPIRGQERLRLDRVTQPRSGPVRLHGIHIGRRQPGLRQRLPDHPLLRRTARRRQTVARTVLVDGRTPHHRQHPVTIAPRIRQPLQQHDTDTLTPARTVRSGGERLAPPVRRQTPLTRELHERPWRRHHGHPARDGERALALPQRLRGQVQRHQRRGARRVDRHRRPFETEDVGQPPRRHTGRAAGEQVSVRAVRRLVEARPVVGRHQSGEDAGGGAAQGGRVDAAPLERLPGRLQEQPLLRVRRQRLARGHAEELGVETVGVVQEAAVAGVGGARVAGVGVVEGVEVPAAVVGERGDGVTAVGDQPPQAVGAVHATRVAAGHAHDDHRVVVRRGGSGCGHGGGPVVAGAEEFGAEAGGQGPWCGVGEDGRRRQPQAGGGVEAVAQFDGAQGVEAEGLEVEPGVDRVGGVVAEDGGGLVLDQPEQQGVPVGLRRRGQPFSRRAAGGVRCAVVRSGLRPRSRAGRRAGRRGGPAGGQPVGPALEGVRRQVDRTGVAEDGGPVDGRPGHVGLGEGGQQPGPVALVAPEGADDGRRVVRCGGEVEGLLDAHGEHGVRAGLDEQPVSVGEEQADGLLEPHGPPQVAVPVLGAQLRGVGHGARRHGRVEGDVRGGPRRDVGEGGEEFVAHGLDARGVGGVVDGDAAGPYALRLVAGQQLVEYGGLAGQHGGGRSVDGGDGDPLAPRGDALGDLGDGQRHGDHAAGPGQPGDRLGAQGDDLRRVAQAQHPGDLCGGDLALRVADHRVGRHPVGLPHLGERHHDRPEGGLDDVDPVQRRRVGLRAQYGGQGPVDERGQGALALCDPRGEDLAVRQQPPSHRHPLGALAGEDEDGTPACDGSRGHHGVLRRPALGDRGEPGEEFVAVAAHDHRALLEHRPGGHQGVADVGRFQLGPVRHEAGESPGLGAQRVGPTGGQHPGHGAGGARAGLPPRFGVRCGPAAGRGLREHHMAVGAAHPEGADGRDEFAALVGPGGQTRLDAEVQLVQRYTRVGRLVVERRRELPVSDAERHLDEPGDARGALQVADVGLHGTDAQRGGPGGAARAEGGSQGGGLDRVADGCAGAVEFDVLDVVRGGSRAPVGLPDDLFLGAGVGCGEAVAAAVVVRRAAADHAQHGVAVGDGPFEGLEDDERAALAAYVAVGAGVEGADAAVRGQPAHPGRGGRALGGEGEVDSAGQGQVALAPPQALAGQVHGDQGRRLGGVDGQAGPAQPEPVRDAVGDDAALETRQPVPADGVGSLAPQQGRVVVPDGADEHSGAAARDAFGDDAGVLEGFPAQFQHQPLLGVHRLRLAGADPEERGVESGDGGPVEESAVREPGAPVGPVRLVAGRVRVPALGRQGDDGVDAVAQEPPVRVRVGGPGQPAGHADDRDRRVPRVGRGGRRGVRRELRVPVRRDAAAVVTVSAAHGGVSLPGTVGSGARARRCRSGAPGWCAMWCATGRAVSRCDGGGRPAARPRRSRSGAARGPAPRVPVGAARARTVSSSSWSPYVVRVCSPSPARARGRGRPG